jgi:hypothetical protein
MIDLLRLLGGTESELVISAPGAGEGFWAGGPSAVVDDDGTTWLAYRLRRPVDQGRGYANVVACAADGKSFETVATVTRDEFGCASLERPALVRRPDGGWRLYVSCSTQGSKHWWVEAVDADEPEGLSGGARTVVLPGSDKEAWKDVIVRANDGHWEMWACRHPLDGGDDAADRMSTWYATSDDGHDWTLVAEALQPTADTWFARGTRIADVVAAEGRWWALFDGRRSAEENWRERSGLAVGDRPDRFSVVAGPIPKHAGTALRYSSVVSVDGDYRIYFEASNADGSHDLRMV